jgi:hypothetical protein
MSNGEVKQDISRKQIRVLCGKKTDLFKLPLTYEEAEKLCGSGIETLDSLWSYIGYEYDRGIDSLADETGIHKSRLIELLSTQAVREARVVGSSWISRHWFDVIIVLVILIVVILTIRVV